MGLHSIIHGPQTTSFYTLTSWFYIFMPHDLVPSTYVPVPRVESGIGRVVSRLAAWILPPHQTQRRTVTPKLQRESEVSKGKIANSDLTPFFLVKD